MIRYVYYLLNFLLPPPPPPIICIYSKTYTMFGLDLSYTPSDMPINMRETHGLVFRACEAILNATQARTSLGIVSTVTVSYVEVYGDSVSDLLRYGQRCGHSKAASQQYVLSGSAEVPIVDMADIVRILRQGEQQKRRAATAMNDRSTRAHGIFILNLIQRDLSSGVTVTSKLFLADLGGSEQVKKSGVEPGQSKIHGIQPLSFTQQELLSNHRDHDGSVAPIPTGGTGEALTFSTGFEFSERMRETVYINLGLLALKKCIESLNNGHSYIPYQDSKLTMLLSGGLANGRTSVVVCANSDPSHIAETVATMRFGERCAKIEMDVRNNNTVMEAVLANIDREITTLEALIVQKERWEVVEETRKDELAEEGTVEAALGGIERRLITVLTGAEEERSRLDEVLKQRAELTGSDIIHRAYEQKVVAFGKKYSYGKKYDWQEEFQTENERFLDKTASNQVPAIVRLRGKEWRTGEHLAADQATLERRAKLVKRNKLVYSGISS
jgi:kinesin family member 5